jgi:hypothetical protein
MVIGKNNVLIGQGVKSEYDNCIIIGANIKSDHDYQIKIGNSRIETSRPLTEDEFAEIYRTFEAIVSGGKII